MGMEFIMNSKCWACNSSSKGQNTENWEPYPHSSWDIEQSFLLLSFFVNQHKVKKWRENESDGIRSNGSNDVENFLYLIHNGSDDNRKAKKEQSVHNKVNSGFVLFLQPSGGHHISADFLDAILTDDRFLFLFHLLLDLLLLEGKRDDFGDRDEIVPRPEKHYGKGEENGRQEPNVYNQIQSIVIGLSFESLKKIALKLISKKTVSNISNKHIEKSTN